MLPKTAFQELLKRLGACEEGRRYVGSRTLPHFWQECDRGDWMLWLCAKMKGQPDWPTQQQIVLVACDCAELSLSIFEEKYPKDSRPREALASARSWANGEINAKVLRAAASCAAAWAADAAARNNKRAEVLKQCAEICRTRLQIPDLAE